MLVSTVNPCQHILKERTRHYFTDLSHTRVAEAELPLLCEWFHLADCGKFVLSKNL